MVKKCKLCNHYIILFLLFFVWQIMHPSMQMVARDFLFACCCIPPAQ